MDNTLICRCEGVCLGAILKAIDECSTSVQGIKKRTRVGMGYCQGRTCQPILRDILRELIGQSELAQTQKSQAPVRPIPLGKL
ncbi:BFD-like [2Fe-2S] binding protein [Ureibacillus xyleni]|uniref:BFD-like [2Fe-2S] binding protein n=1 Tax=Ureibacillus xyleni TaxID=614648 RepID=A0A285SBB2_9BACL|nr:(2Fe-2S)-binding protein [Ureibacillus xyleni]SOC02973.1 BFD-like [2Fe-2S] binding protein [Ureibacillus xyleni]